MSMGMAHVVAPPYFLLDQYSLCTRTHIHRYPRVFTKK